MRTSSFAGRGATLEAVLVRAMTVFSLFILMAGSCGKSQDTPQGEFESLRGEDFQRAQDLYSAGQTEEGARILRSLARHSDWSVRSHAVRLIGEVRDASLLPELGAALKDDRVEVRESAGRVLGWMGTVEELPALREAAGDPEGIVRSHAGAALARIGGEAEIETIGRLLRADEDTDVRATVAISLGELGRREFVALLCEALADPSDVVRTHAVTALGNIGDPSARPALEAIRNDPNEFVRGNVEAVLKRLGTKE